MWFVCTDKSLPVGLACQLRAAVLTAGTMSYHGACCAHDCCNLHL